MSMFINTTKLGVSMSKNYIDRFILNQQNLKNKLIKIKKTIKSFNLIAFNFLITTIRGNHCGSSK